MAAQGIELTCQTPVPLDVARLVHEGINSKWSWPQVFERAGYANAQGGKLFEQFVAALLLQLGVTNLRCNAELLKRNENSQGEQQVVQEVDLIANHGGRLLVVDCKLRSDEEQEAGFAEKTTSQMRQAYTTKDALGGLGAQLMLLRPSLRLSQGERDLAKDYRLNYVDASESRFLISRLAKFTGIRELPPSLQQLEDEVLRHVEQTGDPVAFGKPEYRARRRKDMSGWPLSILDIDDRLEEHRLCLNQDWSAYWLDQKLRIIICKPKGHHWDGAEEKIRKLLPKATVKVRSKSKTRMQIDVIAKGKKLKELQQLLKPYVGRSLLE